MQPERGDSRPASTEPWRQLLADMVLWLALVLLFVAFRATLFWIFGGRLSPRPSGQAFLRCFETGLRSDTCAAMWGLLPSLTLTLFSFFYPLGVWHQRIRRVTIMIVLALCAVVFVTDVAYFAEYDDQFNHWIWTDIRRSRRDPDHNLEELSSCASDSPHQRRNYRKRLGAQQAVSSCRLG